MGDNKDKVKGLANDAKDKANEVKDKAQGYASDAKDKAQGYAAEAKEKAKGYANEAKGYAAEAKDKAKGFAAETKDKAQHYAEEAKHYAADTKDKLQSYAGDAKGKAEDFAHQAGDKAKHLASEAKVEVTAASVSAWSQAKPFVNGGLSGMFATCIIQPVDMVKVRLQLGAKGSPIAVAQEIIAKEGAGGLYKGLSAGLLRQATYTTARLGIFQNLSASLKERNAGKPIPLYQKAGAGLAAGGLGALVGSPADLTLIRMQADSTLPLAQRRNYKGIVDAMVRIVKEDGAVGLFRGAGPTVTRAMALNMGMLASNDQAKELLVDAGLGGQTAVLGGATIAGFFAAACSLPFDFVKTRIQKMEPGPDGKFPYKGSMDCALKTLREEGFLRFYTGFPTYCIRIAPHVTITLLMVAALPKLEAKIGL